MAGASGVEQRDHVRVLNARECAGFGQQLGAVAIAGRVRPNDLDRHPSREVRVPRGIHQPHAALTDALPELEPAEAELIVVIADR